MTRAQTRACLTGGVVATPVFFAVALTLAVTRDGFQLGPHMISQLATGELGWVQMANFVLTGALFVLASRGLARTWNEGIGRVWIPRLVAAFGVGLIAAGVFVTDPSNGYPPGAAASTSWHGMLHATAAALSGLVLVAAAVVYARRAAADGRRIWAVASLIAASASLVLPWTSPGRMGLMLAIGSIIGWGWLSAVSGSVLVGNRVAVVSTPYSQPAQGSKA